MDGFFSASPAVGDASAGQAAPLQRPASVVDHRYALASLAASLLVLAAFRKLGLSNANMLMGTSLCVIAACNLPGEWKGAFRISPRQEPLSARLSRVLTKIYALAAISALIGLGYFVFTGFAQSLAAPMLGFLRMLAVPLAVAAPIYVWFTDTVQDDPRDELYDLGCVLTGQNFAIAWGPALSYLRGWLIKAFFAPLMIGSAISASADVLDPKMFAAVEPVNLYQSAFRTAAWLSIVFGALGYISTFRLLRTHIRSAEPTLFGWAVCIMCYDPFWPVIAKNFLNYEDGYYWGDLFHHAPVMWGTWAVLILVAEGSHAWITASFGMRFSNLTNRGIITNGPYRWMKHPSYVAKLMSYALISVPFVSLQGPAEALRNCIALGLIALIYAARAWSEERHLSADPDYRAYSAWMKEHGLFAILTRPLRRLL